MQIGNVFNNAQTPGTGERFDTLLTHRNLVIERIVSSAITTPYEYKQEQDEWVLLLDGSAEMLVDGERLILNAGDYVFLPTNTPHQVLQTSEGTIWLAIHLHRPQDSKT